VVLFLHGGVTYVYPETLWWDVRELVQKNRVVREEFVVIAPFATANEPLAVVSETRTKTDRFGNIVSYVDDFDEERLWTAFVGACQTLGPKSVDWSRLYVVGYSMGGQSTWNLIVRYGSRLAAAVPFAGCCAWRDDAWNMEESMLRELRGLPIRSYNGEDDTGTFAWRDFMWLAQRRGLAKHPAQRTEAHLEGVELSVYEWGEHLQLCLVRGTASSHCCWDVIFHNEESFLLFSWLQKLRCAAPLFETEGV